MPLGQGVRRHDSCRVELGQLLHVRDGVWRVERPLGARVVQQRDPQLREVGDELVLQRRVQAVELPSPRRGDLCGVGPELGERRGRGGGVEPRLLEQGLVVHRDLGGQVPGEPEGTRLAGDLEGVPGPGHVVRPRVGGGLLQVEEELLLLERLGEVGVQVDDVGQGARGRVGHEPFLRALERDVYPVHRGAGVLGLEIGDDAVDVVVEGRLELQGLEGDLPRHLTGRRAS